ncbi:opsin 8, group member a [Denticeps clupeoides]|uniref:G-protein coupled receptors family 1 profile domain-containing protein n=1 Tax=Denticeps clupeoides TaxID=299321 RepID=A0AAY4BG44_9TELE|nr:opsin-5-like [Denticeps clupeoides]
MYKLKKKSTLADIAGRMDENFTSKLSPAVDYGAGLYLVVVAVLSVLGNAAVIFTAARRQKFLKAPELLTVNLAVTDIGMALSMFSVASIVTLAVMGLVRYLVTGSRPKSGNKFQRRTIAIFIVLIWLYAFTWAIFPLLGWGGYGPEPYGMACSVDWAGYQRSFNSSTFIMALAIFCTIIPCMVLVFSYSGIAWKLHKAYQSIQNINHLPNYGTVEKKVTLMAILISSGFIVSWTPYVAISLWTMFHTEGKDSVTPIVSLLPCLFAKSSTAYNPFIYYVFRKSFQRELRHLRCLCCGPQPGLTTMEEDEAQWRISVGGKSLKGDSNAVLPLMDSNASKVSDVKNDAAK